jgi:hypothetical protein
MHGPTGNFWANLTPFSLQWLTDHCEDPTADGPLTIAQAKKALKPKLTPEEKKQKALELQARAVRQRKKREELEEVERVKKTREGGRKTTEQLRELEEIERKQFIEGKRLQARPACAARAARHIA